MKPDTVIEALTEPAPAAQRLRYVRERILGLSQDAFGQLLVPPVNRAAVSQWETGATRPDIDRAAQVQALTGIPAAEWARKPMAPTAAPSPAEVLGG